jgi:hypothetical protein
VIVIAITYPYTQKRTNFRPLHNTAVLSETFPIETDLQRNKIIFKGEENIVDPLTS